jgi:hypothetical protein
MISKDRKIQKNVFRDHLHRRDAEYVKFRKEKT